MVEDRVEGALGEVAAGGSEVDLPDTEAGIQQLQTLLYILHHTHLQRGHPHVVHKYVCRAVLCVCVCGRGKYPAVFTYGTRKKFVSLQGSHPLSSCKVSNQQLLTTSSCHWICHTVKLHMVCSVRYMNTRILYITMATATPTHMIQDVFASIHPAVVSHKEGNEGGVSAVVVEVVGTLVEAMNVEVTVLTASLR